ncbi:hypothetical protein EBR57_10675 [bacterium]|nr:hypothetical protein [bacterium]
MEKNEIKVGQTFRDAYMPAVVKVVTNVYDDVVELKWSDDCGRTWEPTFEISQNDLCVKVNQKSWEIAPS